MTVEAHGHVTSVARETDGDELTVAATAGAMVLTVRDVADFDEDGGTVRLDDGAGTLRDYVSITDQPPTITLAAAIPSALAAGARVDVWDTDKNAPTVVYKATITDDVTGEPLDADVSHDLIDKLESSVRAGFSESVVCHQDEAGRWSVVDVLGRIPVADGTFIDPETLPEPEPTPPPEPPMPPAAPVLSVPTTVAYAVALAPLARVGLSWSAVTTDVNGDPAMDVVAYELQQQADGESEWQERTRTDGATTTLTLSPYSPGVAWSFRVRAVRTDVATGLSSVGEWSNVQTVTTAVGAAPSTTPTPVVRGGIGALAIATPEVASDITAVVDVWVSTSDPVPTSGAPTFTAPANGASVNFVRAVAGVAVVAGTTYYVRARARNAWGDGPLSAQTSGTPALVTHEDIAADAITANMLTANNALIEALQATDLSAVNLSAVNIDGGSIAIATTESGSYPQGFSGTTFPAGWTNTKTGSSGTGSGSGLIPGASVVSSGPAGQSGSAILIDMPDPGGNGAHHTAGVIYSAVPESADAEVSMRFMYENAPKLYPNLYIALRQQGLAHGGDEDFIGVDFDGFGGTARIVVRTNGSTPLSVGNVYYPPGSPIHGVWLRIRFRILAGAMQLKAWRELDGEPADWLTVQQSGVLTPGRAAILWRQPGSPTAGSESQRVWIDQFDVTTYSTGFKVNPDGTGSWPDVEGRIAADIDAVAGAVADLTSVVGSKAPVASPVFTGNPTAPTPATSDNDTSIATTAFVKALGYAPVASPVFTGNPTAPTPATSDNDTSIATTAFVKAAVPQRQFWESALASSYDVTTTQTQLIGMTLIFGVTGTDDIFEVVAFFDFQTLTGGTAAAVGQLRVDGTPQDRSVIYVGPTTGQRGTAGQFWRLTGLSAGSHTLTLWAYRTAGTGAYRVQPTHTTYSVKRISGT